MAKYPKVSGYRLVKEIGGGGFSSVFEAVNVKEDRVAACKLIFITDDTTDLQRKTMDREMRIHNKLKHKNVLEFISVTVIELDSREVYIPGVYMLLELAAGGDLFDKIPADIGVSEDIAQIYFKQLADGMKYIHSAGVCHRDLKPENILLDAAGTLKICDFGLSGLFRHNGKTKLLKDRCGSLPYMPPEMNGALYEAEPVDIWGMGIILFALLAGNTPWDEATNRSPEFCGYLSGEIFNRAPWNKFGMDALSLMCSLLTVDPDNRITMSEICAHRWFTRSSQLATRGVRGLAEELSQSLRNSGDLMYADPDLSDANSNRDADGDQIMATAQSQFTQSLLLFSQTQSGRQYVPQLTRFYTSIGPGILVNLIKESVAALGVQYRDASVVPGTRTVYRLRVGGYDKRKIPFKGWIELEVFSWPQVSGSFCLMKRDLGNPISWRQFWRALILSPAVSPHVLRRSPTVT